MSKMPEHSDVHRCQLMCTTVFIVTGPKSCNVICQGEMKFMQTQEKHRELEQTEVE